MKRFSTLLKGNKSSSRTYSASDIAEAPADSPEGTASRAVRLFCESGSTNNRDEEVLHLPTIVDAAESSPAAAAACAIQIRAFMQKEYYSKPHVQYNAIMLIRILSDHPGASFTNTIDAKFVKSTKLLLRDCRDHSVQQLVRETLDSLEVNRRQDPGLQGLIAMWDKEKDNAARFAAPRPQSVPFAYAQPRSPGLAHQMPSNGDRHTLPSAAELASRVEESRNTAKILIQFLQTTPADELNGNELIREFADRCQTAQRSMQNYINCDSPAPDDDTLQTLIETNEQLSLATSRYQRAVLASRRAGVSPNRAPAPAAPPPQVTTAIPQSTFGSTLISNPSPVARTSQLSPVSPPQSYVQPTVTALPPITPPAATQRDEEYDDLYDSPRATRAPISNPFSDPVQPEDSASVHDLPAAHRPNPAPWHNSTITPSFLGRQASAADGLTMHAPQGLATPEIDGHSNVGRVDYARAATQNSFIVNSPVARR